MTSGFAAHFLTDAFAGGHVVSGVFGRKSAPAWFAANKAAIEAARGARIRRRHHRPGQGDGHARGDRGRGRRAGHHAQARPRQVQRGTASRSRTPRAPVWATKGDGHLAAAPRPRRRPRRRPRARATRCRRRSRTARPRTRTRLSTSSPTSRRPPGRAGARSRRPPPTRGCSTRSGSETMIAPGTVFFNARQGLRRQAPRPARLQGQALRAQEDRERQAHGPQVPRQDRGVRRQAQAARLGCDRPAQGARARARSTGSPSWARPVSRRPRRSGARSSRSARRGREGEGDRLRRVDKVKEIGSGIGGWFSDRWDDAKSLGSGAVDKAK